MWLRKLEIKAIKCLGNERKHPSGTHLRVNLRGNSQTYIADLTTDLLDQGLQLKSLPSSRDRIIFGTQYNFYFIFFLICTGCIQQHWNLIINQHSEPQNIYWPQQVPISSSFCLPFKSRLLHKKQFKVSHTGLSSSDIISLHNVANWRNLGWMDCYTFSDCLSGLRFISTIQRAN